MLRTLLFESYAKYALLRAAYWGVMGILLFAVPSFLFMGMFYAIIGYMLVDGILHVVNFYKKKTGSPLRYVSLVIAVLLMAVVIHSIVFRHLLIELTPVYLGGLLLLESLLYAGITLCAHPYRKRALLGALSGMVLLSGAAVLVFTFGFGVGGISGLAKVSGAALLLVCLYEGTAYFVYRKNAEQPLK
ncbi:hypothetical protein [Paenibacillus sanguinis]|uniref:hypothetical protein n=1 Tax=Paenibacillus sanguinis TaxID=225906 RepID=UPI0003812C18|nr:hypothetical protein [Paenibacillus sanguinis]